MPGSLFSSFKKVHILALEKDLICLSVIREFARGNNFLLIETVNEEEAYELLSRSFYHILICNAALLDKSGRFIKNLRNLRGYEKIPVLVLTDHREHEHITPLLDSGADGYIIKPLSMPVLQSHFNLFLRRSQFQKSDDTERLKKDLNLEKGSLVICSEDGEVEGLPLTAIEAKVILARSEQELFAAIEEENVWGILIAPDARWALQLVPKIKADHSLNIQIILLKNRYVLDADVVDFFNNGGDDITSLNKPAFILARQINSRLERELYYKQKYINAVKTAAEKLPVRFQPEASFTHNRWHINVFHRADNEIPGGDFYEVISLEGNSRLILMGDVMGKNWEAWHFSVAYLGYIRSMARRIAGGHKLNPALFLQDLNRELFTDLRLSEIFTTLTVILIHDQSPLIKVASAGGLPLYLLGKNSEVKEYRATGTLLGINDLATFELLEIEMAKDELLFTFTDGYIEARTNAGKPAGARVMIKAITDALKQDHLDLAHADKLVSESSGAVFSDDRTLLCLLLN